MSNVVKNILAKKRPVASGVGLEEVRAMAAEAARRAQQQIGGGQFGQVYETGPGLVTKEITLEKKQNLLNEINMQAKAAELGIAPKIQEASLMPPRIGEKVIPIEPGVNPNMRGEITMQDLRNNYILAGTSVIDTDSLTKQQQLDQAKQMSILALNNISLGDRHPGNIMFNKMTGRPMQIDFGSATELKTNRAKAASLSLSVAQGLNAAGLREEASIFKGVVEDLLYTDPEGALDVAKQGLSRLQKIKQPLNSGSYKYATTNRPEDFISVLG